MAMKNLAPSLQALSTGDAGSSGLGSKPFKAPAADFPTTTRLSLETLPVELQLLIMGNATDLTWLGALIRASPQLHRVYAEHRRSVLRDLVTQTLEGLEVDAVGAYLSGTESFQNTRTESLLWSFVEEQQARYSGDPPPPGRHWTAELSLDAIISILRFHFSVVEPLTGAFAPWALRALPSKPENQAACKSTSLSDTERRRIYRAFYRLQMFCNLCGSRGAEKSAPTRISDTVDRLRVLSMFPGWEVQEILIVHDFATDQYAKIFKQVAWDLDEGLPKYKHIGLDSANESLVLINEMGDGTQFVNEISLNMVLRYGPHLLAETLEAKSHEQLVELIRAAIESSSRAPVHASDFVWMNEVQDEFVQADRRAQWPTYHDSAQDRREKTPFYGDQFSAPPLAWVLFWQGEYSNLFGMHIPRELRRWAFVMWDAARLDLDAEDKIYRAWCIRSDPRQDNWDSSVRDLARPLRKLTTRRGNVAWLESTYW